MFVQPLWKMDPKTGKMIPNPDRNRIRSTRFSESGMQYIRERAGKLTNVIAAQYLQWAADQGEFRLPENWERQVPALAEEISAGEIGVKTWLQWIVRIPRTISPQEFSSYTGRE